jgi:kynurenine 3-monooxygenase
MLNEKLLSEVTASPNIKVMFQHKVQSIDFERRFLSAKNLESNVDVDVGFDFLIGADGSYSVVRRQMMRVVRFVKSSSFHSPLSENR